MRFGNPAGLALLGLAVPVILTHILRPRRMPVTVSSTMLWRKLERPVAAAKPWQRLRWSLLLLAQLLAVVGLAAAVAKPDRVEASTLAQHTVFIIDASGSMAATDGTPDRLADAVDRALDLRGDLPANGLASVVIAGDTPRVALTASPDSAEFERSLRTIDQSAGHPDFADAFSLAESLDTGTTPIGYVFLTDGGLEDTEARLLPPGTRVERIGNDDTNRAITRLIVDSRTTGLHARVSVRNTGGPDVTQTVRVDVDGVTAASQAVTLAAGEQTDVEFDIPEGDLVEAFLEGGDLLSADDHAVAVAKQTTDVRVLLAGDTLFWEQLLASLPGVTVETSETSEPADGYDLAIYSGVDVPDDPGAPFIAIAAPGGLTVDDAESDEAGTVDELVVEGDIERPAVTLVRTDDPLLHGIDLSDVAIATAQHVQPGSAEVLVAGEDAPLLMRGQYGGERFAYFAFDLRDSNLGVQLAFPLLAQRLVGSLSGTESAGLSLMVGDRLPVAPAGDETVTVTGPDARPIDVEPGQPAPRALRSGFFTISVPDRPDIVVAVNAPPGESELALRDVTAPPATQRSAGEASERAISLLPWVLWPLLAIVLVELLLAWRNVGVGRRQWYIAVGVRAVVAALLIAAIVDPVIRRPAERVATVFVIDGSASVGTAGTAAAQDFVTAALDKRPDSALAGVVVFGADARVDQVMGDAAEFGGPSAVIDRGATDVAGGLRLGSALLPNDARRRIVLVSDGRVTAGDISDEIEELESAGIPVDVVTLETTGGPDVAIARIDLPDLARPDETVPVVVHVQSSEATTAEVVLRRDGVEIGRQTVELAAGDNEVRFEDQPGADAGAVMRYQATVTSPNNTVAENDIGFAAVPVEGPARVLVIEGTDGEADTVVSALNAGGVGTEVIGVGNIPDVQELITYAGVVMVNVDARNLTGDQIDNITTAVRDLGRGLVTIGGVRSYGVGGYRESPLNDLLPVDSEIVDPMRRRTVAEVLSIDTSESMGACHCAGEGQMNASAGGGVNKTDISRAAAERTIAALSENDEVGVLAWNSSAEWVIELQTLPPADVIDHGLRSLQPSGNTDISDSLTDAAEALLASDAELKHIILFTDGFTAPGAIEDTAEEAARLYEEHGITVSVLATGESPEQGALEDIATAGHGRFYAGTDLQNIPEIMAEEAVIASRNFITEGEFFPEVTSDDEVVAGLTESPPLLGYVATTAKGQATTLLRIGPDRDPLLATWQAGLGRVSSWTSDTTNWAQEWARWDGFVDFFSGVVKDTLPAGENAGAVQAEVRDGQIRVTVDSADAFPDGATGTANIAGPDGQSISVDLERTDEGHFEGVAEAPRSGTYAVSAVVSDNDGETVLSSSTLTSNSYPAEYVPGRPDAAFMTRVANATGGRTDVTSENVWDSAGLDAGTRTLNLLPLLLLAACLLWPIAVILSRISVRGATAAGARQGLGNVGRGLRDLFPKIGGKDPEVGAVRRPTPVRTEPVPDMPAAEPAREREPVAAHTGPPATPAARPAEASTLNDLLAKKRERRKPSD